ncbi:hypothetical protein ASPZODRAFT_744929 [Penicilliopsis zonata CBS 506.65]|uniref:Uncharacterized protein n=1 Tax=Penicilliopsis zonata CBS 506.65 TaxID=1073090 RepID=A0A1L9SCF2_9EURO|nr:hypothetical protein ASPZODRAFT_744929 [Penicilliopsis zonata CBS 506.65]OJJ44823.1 hypothetical protein ASPZODRAFT_744929 [Penicilliopsis zonata CBS 506.65]
MGKWLAAPPVLVPPPGQGRAPQNGGATHARRALSTTLQPYNSKEFRSSGVSEGDYWHYCYGCSRMLLAPRRARFVAAERRGKFLRAGGIVEACATLRLLASRIAGQPDPDDLHLARITFLWLEISNNPGRWAGDPGTLERLRSNGSKFTSRFSSPPNHLSHRRKISCTSPALGTWLVKFSKELPSLSLAVSCLSIFGSHLNARRYGVWSTSKEMVRAALLVRIESSVYPFDQVMTSDNHLKEMITVGRMDSKVASAA